MTKVVVVESPSKAKTINGYLGKEFVVKASYGHICDLSSESGSVDPDADFAVKWHMGSDAQKRVKEIADLCKGADELILATDPDREGEAISWHVYTEIKKVKALAALPIRRVSFYEITKKAITEAMKQGRDIDQHLVDAYLARRALDYLVGYTLSPVLWRKLPGARSAGRVQSVALRSICDREREIEIFVTQEYWSIDGIFETQKNDKFKARLVSFDGEKLDKFSLKDEEACRNIIAAIKGDSYAVVDIEEKTASRAPYAPFSTSTLQQDANRKLHFSASQTMQIAQKLYEGIDIGQGLTGLITYMRTDSVVMSSDAMNMARDFIKEKYGVSYLSPSPRIYKSKAKNAQEAHECIRPSNFANTPEKVKPYLTADQWALYDLIWRRALASQAANALFDRVIVHIKSSSRRADFRAHGSVLTFKGFLEIYQETAEPSSSKDDGEEQSDSYLPPLKVQETLAMLDHKADQHFTKPPARFSEASLVKEMEELGIGRPSTYASILRVLQDREYVTLEKGRFIPCDRGRLVVAFLSCFFEKYVDYHFTADLEEKLDMISDGNAGWKDVLRDFWSDFNTLCDQALELTGTDVRDKLDQDLGSHFFKVLGNSQSKTEEEARKCPSCQGTLHLNFGKLGYFIACSNYPDCRYTRKASGTDGGEGAGDEYPKLLGTGEDDLEGKYTLTLRMGPYGAYLQKDLERDKGNEDIKPKRVPVPKNMDLGTVNFETAMALISLPRLLGSHPDTGKNIYAGIGRFGPFLRMDKKFVSLTGDDHVLTVGLNRAITLIDTAEAKKPSGRLLGVHPQTGADIMVEKGRFGPYLKMGKVNVSVKADVLENLSLEDAAALIDKKAQAGTSKGKKVADKKAAPKKTAAKKTTKKEDADKKSTTKEKVKSSKAASKKELVKKTTAKK